MKKNVKNVLVVSTAALALVGSLISCAQPVAPTPTDKSKTTTKDVFEQNLETARMEAESLFGKNIIKFYDVNYADDNEYKLYRFGPMDDPLKGKPLTLSTSNKSADSFYYEDKVDFDNPMVAGSYTYKLVAKSSINSARAVATKDPDLSINGGTDAANQDYWANPNVDIVYIPSVASVSFNVSESNMPKLKTKLTLTKDELKGKYVVVDEENTIWFYPGVGDNLELEARLSKIDPNFDFSNNDSTGTTDVTFVANKTAENKINKLVIPYTTAGTWDIYATKKFDNDYYRRSEKVLVDTIKVDPIGKDIHSDGKVIVTQYESVNKLGALTYKLDKDLNYTFEAMRAEKVSYKYAKEENSEITAKKEYYSDVTPVKFDTKVVEVKDTEGKVTSKNYVATDTEAKAGKTYRYFWTFKDGDRVIDYGETELTVSEPKNITLANYLTVEDFTAEQLTATALKATDLTWNKLTNNLTVKVAKATVTESDLAKKAEKEALIKNIFDNFKVVVKRVSVGTKETEIKDISATMIPGANGEMYISISDDIPFLEDNKEKSKDGKYYYWYYITGGDGTVFPAWHNDTCDVTSISKKRYETENATLSVEGIPTITTNSIKINLKANATAVTYKNRADIRKDTPVLNRADLDKVPLTEFAVKYDLKCNNNKSYVIKGADLTTDANITAGKAIELTIDKLVPGMNYTITCSHSIKQSETTTATTYTFSTKDLVITDYNFAITPKYAFPTPATSSDVANYKIAKDAKNNDGFYAHVEATVNISAKDPKDASKLFAEYELIDVTRKVNKVAPNNSNANAVRDIVWKNGTTSATQFIVERNDSMAGKMPVYTIKDNFFPFDNVADGFKYEFRFWNAKENSFATVTTNVIPTKSNIRWSIGYDPKNITASDVKADSATITVKPQVKIYDTSYGVSLNKSTLPVNDIVVKYSTNKGDLDVTKPTASSGINFKPTVKDDNYDAIDAAGYKSSEITGLAPGKTNIIYVMYKDFASDKYAIAEVKINNPSK